MIGLAERQETILGLSIRLIQEIYLRMQELEVMTTEWYSKAEM